MEKQQAQQQQQQQRPPVVDPKRVKRHEDLRSFLKMLKARAHSGDDQQGGDTFELEYGEAHLHRGSQLIVQLVEKKQKKELAKNSEEADLMRKNKKKMSLCGKVRVLFKYCERCHSWHEEEKDTFTEVPHKDHTYFNFNRRGIPDGEEEPITPDCGDDLDELGSDYNDDDGPTAKEFEDMIKEVDPLMQGANPNPQRALVEAWTVKFAKSWRLYSGKPDMVHNLAWAALSSSTRSNHLRILRDMQNIPSSQDDVPLAQAVVEMTLSDAEQGERARLEVVHGEYLLSIMLLGLQGPRIVQHAGQWFHLEVKSVLQAGGRQGRQARQAMCPGPSGVHTAGQGGL